MYLESDVTKMIAQPASGYTLAKCDPVTAKLNDKESVIVEQNAVKASVQLSGELLRQYLTPRIAYRVAQEPYPCPRCDSAITGATICGRCCVSPASDQ